MKAITFRHFGDPGVLEMTEVRTPEPGPGEVLLRVLAAGVCHHDVLHRSGRLPKARADWILGHEVSGRVERLGPGVEGPKPGTPVVAYNRMFCGVCRGCLEGRHDLCRRSRLLGSTVPGGYAEFVVVRAETAIPIPHHLDPVEAALTVCPIGTSIRALIGVAGIGPGDTVLVVGAGGGLGLHQLQIARAVGADTIAVTSSPAKVARLESFGAEVVVSDGSFAERVRELLAGREIDVVMENVATPTLSESVRTVRPGGTVVVMGNVDVAEVPINPGLIITRRIAIVGSGNPTFDDVRRSLQLLSTKRVHPVIGLTLPFSEAAQAHERVEARSVMGRAVLTGW